MSTIPTIKHFKPGDRLYVQAQRIWLILVSFVMSCDRKASRPCTITYGDLALRMGYEDRRAGHTLARQLGIVGELCVSNGLPALNAIVVNKDTGVPGDEVLLREGVTLAQEQRAVMEQDWFELRVPTSGTFRQVWEASQV